MKKISLAILLACFIAVKAQAPYLTSNYFGAGATSVQNPLTSFAGPGTSSSTNLPYIPPSFASHYTGSAVNSFSFPGTNQGILGTTSQSGFGVPPISTINVSPTSSSSSSGIPNFQGLPSGTPRTSILGGTPSLPGGSAPYPGGLAPYLGGSPRYAPAPLQYPGGPAPYPGGMYSGLGSLTLRYRPGSGYYSGYVPRRPIFGGTFVAGHKSPVILQGGYNYNLGNTGGFLGLGRNGLWIIGLLFVLLLLARDDK